LIVVQTAIVPAISGSYPFYDLFIVFVFYLGLYRPVREGLPVVFIVGLTMDNLSGAPFGLYITIYFWLFVGMRWIIKYLRAENKLFLSLVVVVAVIIENFLVMGTFAFFGPSEQLPAEAAKNIALQTVWALVTGPLFLLSLLSISKRFHIQLNGAGAAPKT
jgi:rod shape-determining protein MreD